MNVPFSWCEDRTSKNLCFASRETAAENQRLNEKAEKEQERDANVIRRCEASCWMACIYAQQRWLGDLWEQWNFWAKPTAIPLKSRFPHELLMVCELWFHTLFPCQKRSGRSLWNHVNPMFKCGNALLSHMHDGGSSLRSCCLKNTTSLCDRNVLDFYFVSLLSFEIDTFVSTFLDDMPETHLVQSTSINSPRWGLDSNFVFTRARGVLRCWKKTQEESLRVLAHPCNQGLWQHLFINVWP